MKLFYTDHFILPLPPGHRFPMEKYSRLRMRLLASGQFRPDDLHIHEAGGYARNIDDTVAIHASTLLTATSRLGAIA